MAVFFGVSATALIFLRILFLPYLLEKEVAKPLLRNSQVEPKKQYNFSKKMKWYDCTLVN
ncbi:hypothetical protein DP113_06370 [Brasilonema octagenarum UFV-E1]|jgi:hypothetical protein|uniref:Uncharacterized protein n=2 Tax=Brasilonema TaxID=383614 RepID=A0A856MBW1_9CYAN|nr:hypothetical protein [Brasilonema octagenarum UFV-OR1]QDL07579.1 hypothetical protein DP114_06420 [Brasilonema sennae CENA114]QDL13940.1 hypothetical protein DP113_06370 [Brasilonema octagenarum UFV-E1]